METKGTTPTRHLCLIDIVSCGQLGCVLPSRSRMDTVWLRSSRALPFSSEGNCAALCSLRNLPWDNLLLKPSSGSIQKIYRLHVGPGRVQIREFLWPWLVLGVGEQQDLCWRAKEENDSGMYL